MSVIQVDQANHHFKQFNIIRHGAIMRVEFLVPVMGCYLLSTCAVADSWSPLKAYLPDGDIDLTVTNRNVDDLAIDIFNMLVKILKCIVQNISVDISFNQMAGLCALCFSEQVDLVIGKSHLFKESLILVKAWCYYESRILGAHHGLISTYALETLVLFIINIFHASIKGPLAVLYKFLSYFSTFEWDKYGITINGAVPIPSLQTVSDMPKDDGDQQLLHPYFLRTCKSIFSATPNTSESGEVCFLVKDMNIVDPLNDNNNIGRSVSTSIVRIYIVLQQI